MSDDILEKIDDTLTFYSAGLGEEITVPVERGLEAVEATGVIAEYVRVLAGVGSFEEFVAAFVRTVDPCTWRALTSIAWGDIQWPMPEDSP